MIRLKTKRLIVRDPLQTDIDEWHRLLSDSKTMYYLPDIMTRSLDESRRNLDVALDEARNPNRSKYFFAIENSETSAFIGTVGYTVTKTTPLGKFAGAGYFILPEYHGQGYMTEALNEVIRFAFEDDGVYIISTGCITENRASERVMQKCGLIKEAEYKSYTWHDGRIKDRAEYRLLKDEWMNTKKPLGVNGNNEPAHNIFTNTMADMKWPDIQHYADKNAVVLLPMGVIEEHGPHLCLATDIYTAQIYCESVRQKLDKKGYAAIIAPPFYWGICQAAGGFVGSFNIRSDTMKALLFDILSSLKGFGFKRIFAVNAHGDIEHKIVAMNGFKEACEQLEITACFPHDDFMLHHFGLSNDAPCFYTIMPQKVKISEAAVGDVHAGDIETATINTFYPHLVDTQKAKLLPDVSLGDNFEAWMFGGQLKQLSPQGYLGSPANYESADIQKNIEDNAHRISEAIITRLNRN